VPIYEYACPGCGSRFEKLVRRFSEAVSCPACARADVEKQLSVFAVGAAAPAPAAFAGCGAGACAAGEGGCAASPCGDGACGLPS
jgi:putative FmdB family regulatory protein